MAHNYGNPHPPPRVVAQGNDSELAPEPREHDIYGNPDDGNSRSCCTATIDVFFSALGILDDKNRLCGVEYFVSTNNCSQCEWEYTPDGKCPNEGMFTAMSVQGAEEGSCYFTANIVITEDLGECDCAAWGFQTPGDPAPRPLLDPYGTEGQDPDHPPEGILICGDRIQSSQIIMFDECREGGCMFDQREFEEYAQFIAEEAKYELLHCCTGEPVRKPGGQIIPISKAQLVDSFKEALANGGTSAIRNIDTGAEVDENSKSRFTRRMNRTKQNIASVGPNSKTSGLPPAIKPELNPSPGDPDIDIGPDMTGCCSGGAIVNIMASGNVDDDGCLHGWSLFIEASANSYCEAQSMEFPCDNDGNYSSSDVYINEDTCFFSAKFFVHKDMGRCSCPTTATFGTGIQRHERRSFSPCDPSGCSQFASYIRSIIESAKGNVPAIVPCCNSDVPSLEDNYRSGDRFTINDDEYTVTTMGDSPLQIDPLDWYGIPVQKVIESLEEALANGGKSHIRSMQNYEVVDNEVHKRKHNENIQRLQNRQSHTSQNTENTQTIVLDERLDTIVHMLDNVTNSVENTSQSNDKYLFRGEWSALKPKSTEYEFYRVNDIVSRNGVSYVCIRNCTGQIDPEVNSEGTRRELRFWDLWGGRPTRIDGGLF